MRVSACFCSGVFFLGAARAKGHSAVVAGADVCGTKEIANISSEDPIGQVRFDKPVYMTSSLRCEKSCPCERGIYKYCVRAVFSPSRHCIGDPRSKTRRPSQGLEL
jgi:hypothetical protein